MINFANSLKRNNSEKSFTHCLIVFSSFSEINFCEFAHFEIFCDIKLCNCISHLTFWGYKVAISGQICKKINVKFIFAKIYVSKGDYKIFKR